MFNSKLKQEITALQIANQQLQEQYNLVHGLLLQRQDEVVALKQQIVEITNQDPENIKDGFAEIKERLENDIDSLKELLSDFNDLLSDEDECDNLDEDEE